MITTNLTYGNLSWLVLKYRPLYAALMWVPEYLGIFWVPYCVVEKDCVLRHDANVASERALRDVPNVLRVYCDAPLGRGVKEAEEQLGYNSIGI